MKNFWKETDWKRRVRTPASSKCLSVWQGGAKAIVCSEATCQLEFEGGGKLTLRLAGKVSEQDKHFYPAQVLFSSCCAVDIWKLLIRSLWRDAGMIQPIYFIGQSKPLKMLSEPQSDVALQGSACFLSALWVKFFKLKVAVSVRRINISAYENFYKLSTKLKITICH